MSKVKAEVAGSVLTLLGYDGTDFYNVLVDVDGRLQIDVIGSALPAGAATAANQALLLGELEEKLETADLMIDANGRLITVPKAFDGGAYRDLHCNTSGDLHVQGKDQLFSYKDRIADRVVVSPAAAGGNYGNSGSPPADERWVITSMMAVNETSNWTETRIGIYDGATYQIASMCAARNAKDGLVWAGQIILDDGDNLRVKWDGCLLNDVLLFYFFGYTMSW